jgi:leucyl aminopeptidase
MFSSVESFHKRKAAGLVVLPFWQSSKKGKSRVVKPAAIFTSLDPLLKPALESGDFEGKQGETMLVYMQSEKEPRCLLLGLGLPETLTVEKIRLAYAQAAKIGQKKAVTHVNIVVPTISEIRVLTPEVCLKGIAEGILLTNYQWEKLATVDEETVLFKSICLVGVVPSLLRGVKECAHIAEGVYLARDLINGNADIITPLYLAEAARKIAQKFPAVKATIFDKKRIEQEKMGLFLAVARGSHVEPTFVQLSYKGFPGSKDHTVLVGKGVTFDTGGLNLKPQSSMVTMRDDMSGAAVALATIAVAASLNLKLNLTAIIAATENAIGSKSYKPGDVYIGYDGTTVEIIDTDAEGRLTLADALAYSVKMIKPTRMIDLATLTGSVVVALGEEISGLFCNDEKLAEALLESGKRTCEILWRMPLYAPYEELLKSDIADLKNVGGRAGGSIVAGLFLQKFVQNIPWAHIDIAGTAFASKEKGYWPKNGVGFGVRLLIDFLQQLSKK